MRGRRPKPTHLKLIEGNPGKRPLNKTEPQPARNLPRPPSALYPEAKREWRRVAGELHRLGLLTLIDRGPFACYCQSYARWIRAEKVIAEMAKGDPLTQALLVKSRKGTPVQNPLVLTARQAASDMLRAASEFGLTPSARTRLNGTTAPNNGNVFSEF